MNPDSRPDIERRICGAALAAPAAWRVVRSRLPDVPFNDRLAAVVRGAADEIHHQGGSPGLQEVTIQIHASRPSGLPDAWWGVVAGWLIDSTTLDIEWACTRVAEIARNETVARWSAAIANETDRERREKMMANPPPVPRALSRSKEWKDIVLSWGRDFEARCRGDIPPPPQHGLRFLDDSQGGCWPGDLEVIAGEPGGGKTLVMLQVGAFLSAQIPTIYASYEMPEDMVAMRMVAHMAGVGPKKLRRPDPADKMTIVRAGKKIGDVARLQFHYMLQPSMEQLAAKALNVGARVILFDYIQRAAEIETHSREQAVATVSSGLKQLALRTGTTVIAGSQVNKEGGLRESAAIGHDADSVYFLGEESVKVGKSRYAPGGSSYPIFIDFETQAISDLYKEEHSK